MCEDCRVRALERKRVQSGVFDEPKARPIKKGGYESKSKKVWRDRYEAARKDLKQAIEWYARARERGWHDNWLYKRLGRNDWYPQRYRRARTEAKAHGAI